MDNIDNEEVQKDLIALIEKHQLSNQGILFAIMRMYNTNKELKKIDLLNWLFEN
jgi:hypothetical protein